MLALLPQILFLGTFAATVIRLTLAVMLVITAWNRMSQPDVAQRTFAAFEVVVAVLLIAGAWTQVAAILGVVMLAVSITVRNFRAWPLSTTILMLVMMLTLVVTGPGAIAFDLPL